MSKTTAEIEVNGASLVLIEASKLNMNDAFMQYNPKTREEKRFKIMVTLLILRKVKDFWAFKQYPFSNDTGNGISFKRNGSFPVASCAKWEQMAKKVLPEMESDLSTRSQFWALHAVLLKKLVEAGVKIEKAWRMVCIDHIELMEYLNTSEAKENPTLDGIRDVNLFYNLFAMSVIIKHEDQDGYWIREGLYDDHVSAYGLVNCNLEKAYWIAGISTSKGRKYSLTDFDICSVADKPIKNGIGFVVCNVA